MGLKILIFTQKCLPRLPCISQDGTGACPVAPADGTGVKSITYLTGALS